MVGTAVLAALGLGMLSVGAGAQTLVRAHDTSRPPAEAAPSPPGPNTELARALQKELKRLGCLEGEANGIWGSKSRAAFKNFVRQAKLGVDGDDPNVSVLDAASATRMRACTAPARAEDSAVEEKREAQPPRQVRQEPVKVEPRRVEKVEKYEQRQAAKVRQAREAKVQRERDVKAYRAHRERQARAYVEPRERGQSANSGKRLCFGAARTELVACP
jgi:peptidoglycan hydrolase-like protein with peptidoglycan-binding domain